MTNLHGTNSGGACACSVFPYTCGYSGEGMDDVVTHTKPIEKNKEQLQCCTDSHDAPGEMSISVLYKDIMHYFYQRCALEMHWVKKLYRYLSFFALHCIAFCSIVLRCAVHYSAVHRRLHRLDSLNVS